MSLHKQWPINSVSGKRISWLPVKRARTLLTKEADSGKVNEIKEILRQGVLCKTVDYNFVTFPFETLIPMHFLISLPLQFITASASSQSLTCVPRYVELDCSLVVNMNYGPSRTRTCEIQSPMRLQTTLSQTRNPAKHGNLSPKRALTSKLSEMGHSKE